MKILLSIALIIFTVAFISESVLAQEIENRESPSVGLKIIDLFIVRPPCVPIAIISTAIHIGFSPLTYLTGIGEQSARVLVEAPWRFIGERRWGYSNQYKDGKPITVIETF